MVKLSKKLVIGNNTGALLGAVPSHTHTHARTYMGRYIEVIKEANRRALMGAITL